MKIKINVFDAHSIDAAIKQLEDYSKSLERKATELKQRLASAGYLIASEGFGSALYDGTNDVSVELIEEQNRLVIRASGETVYFIEFGTGVHNAEHPLQSGGDGDLKSDLPGLVGHGQYGYGLGRLESWRYPMSKGAGTGGEPDPKHKGYYITRGNSANMPMYNAAKDIRSEVLSIAREVFKT